MDNEKHKEYQSEGEFNIDERVSRHSGPTEAIYKNINCCPCSPRKQVHMKYLVPIHVKCHFFILTRENFGYAREFLFFVCFFQQCPFHYGMRFCFKSPLVRAVWR